MATALELICRFPLPFLIEVLVEASINPSFLDQVPSSEPTFIVRALDDPTSNSSIPGIDFRIVVELNN